MSADHVSKDISNILDGWNYEPDKVLVRIVQGDDGQEKIQLRLDLGLLQMCVDGRPDGIRPQQCESWLDYYLRESQAADNGQFSLDEEDCGRLLREGVQYYHRYLSFWHLKRYELCARDTARNLRLFSFIRKHAKNDRDKLQFDQWRPYVTMMHARAVATPLVEMRDYAGAMPVIESGIRAIWKFLEEYDQLERAEQCGELATLKKWRDEVAALLAESVPKSARTSIQILRTRLDEAVAEERFEEAAQLRDEIRRLTDLPAPAPPGE